MTSTYSISPEALENFPHVNGSYYLPFHVNHLDSLDGIEGYIQMLGLEAFKAQIAGQATRGPVITAFLHGKPVAVFGCGLLWNGVAEVWSLLSPTSKRYPIAMIRASKAFLDICWITFNLHRLQISVKTSDNVAMRFALALKFEPEGIMAKYSPAQEDFTLLRRL
jgi:hypothetical protein